MVLKVLLALLEETFLRDEETREYIYAMAETVAKSGPYVPDFNQAVGEAAGQAITQQENSGFLMSKLTNFIVVDALADKLLEYEKAIVYFAISKIVEASGIPSGLPFGPETFSAGINAWIASDFYEDIQGIANIVSEYIYSQLKPFVFSFFIPFLLCELVVMLIPIIHFLISKRRQQKKISAEATVSSENE
ncbi:MAG: hypothetical protein ACI8XB_001089 [Patiriisocius sp.]|jgi:hypothetical protein